MQWKYFLKLISVPLTFFVIYAMYVLLWRLFGLPTDQEMVMVVQNAFDQYGLLIVFVGSIIEGMLLAGNYFPGGLIIFLGVITAGKNVERAALVVAVVTMAFFIAYTLNYLLGRYGWYRLLVRFGLKDELTKAESKLQNQGLNAVVFSYWQPNLAAITSTAAGVLRLNLRKFLFYSAVGIIIWNAFWGTLVYRLGAKALALIHNIKYVLAAILLWMIIILIKEHFQHKRQNNL